MENDTSESDRENVQITSKLLMLVVFKDDGKEQPKTGTSSTSKQTDDYIIDFM